MSSEPHPTTAKRPFDIASDWRLRTATWSVALAAAGYMGFAIWSGWGDVVDAIGMVGIVGICLVLTLSLVNYGLRFVRWQAYLNALAAPVPWRHGLAIYLAGFALTTTPGKAGEALRGVLLKRLDVPYPKSFAALLSERLSDLLAVVLLALVGLAGFPDTRPIVAISVLAIVMVLAVVANPGLLERWARVLPTSVWLSNLLRHLVETLQHARHCHRPRLLASATTLSLLAWTAEAWAFYCVLHWMGFEVPLGFAVFVYAVSMLAGAVSFMPGGLGGAEAAMVGLLVWHEVGTPEAVAATLIIRMGTLWFAVAIGCGELLWLGRPARGNSVPRRP